MPQIIKNYEWQIEGTVDTSVWFRLGLDCVVKGSALLAAELGAVFCDGVTIAHGKQDMICDGQRCRDGSVNPEMPQAVLDFYINAFKAEYDRSEHIRDEIFESVINEAVGAHFELLAA